MQEKLFLSYMVGKMFVINIATSVTYADGISGLMMSPL